MTDRYSFRWINIAFLFTIAGMLIYCYFVFHFGSQTVVCIHQRWLGRPCASCGLTRGMGMALHGKFSAARTINSLSIKIFVFFAIQMLMRFLAVAYSFRSRLIRPLVVYADMAISLFLFLFCFKELVSQTFSMVFKLN